MKTRGSLYIGGKYMGECEMEFTCADPAGILEEKLPSILDAELVCQLCGRKATVGECVPAIDVEGRYGCPVPDCGGIMQEGK